MSRERSDRRPALLVVGCVAGLLYANFILDWILRGFEGMDLVVSTLGAPGEPHAVVLRVTDVVCGVLVVALLPRVRSLLPPGRWREVAVWATVVFALGAAAAAAVPTPCGAGETCDAPHQLAQSLIHNGASIVSEGALFVGMAAVWRATHETGPVWLRRVAFWDFWVGGVVFTSLFAYFGYFSDALWIASAAQRVHILFVSAWIVCLGVVAAHPHHLDPSSRRERPAGPGEQGPASARTRTDER